MVSLSGVKPPLIPGVIKEKVESLDDWMIL